LLTILLANVGIIGAAAFFCAVFATVLGAESARRATTEDKLKPVVLAAVNTLIVSLALSVVSGFKYVVLDTWFIWGMLLALITLTARRSDQAAKPVGAVQAPARSGGREVALPRPGRPLLP